MNIKQKFLIFLNLLIIPFFSHALPENAPKIGSIVIGAVTGVIAVGNQNPLLLIPALCVTAATHKYLQRFTPTYRLNLAHIIIQEIGDDPLVKFEKKNYNNKPVCKSMFLEFINRQTCYQVNLKEKGFPILIARDTLIRFQAQLNIVKDLLTQAGNDLSDEDKKPESLYSTLNTLHKGYTDYIATSLGNIILCDPEYKEALKYEQSKSQLALQKDNNQTQQIIAQAQQQSASATTQQAQAANSYSKLAWVKYIIYLLTGWGNLHNP